MDFAPPDEDEEGESDAEVDEPSLEAGVGDDADDDEEDSEGDDIDEHGSPFWVASCSAGLFFSFTMDENRSGGDSCILQVTVLISIPKLSRLAQISSPHTEHLIGVSSMVNAMLFPPAVVTEPL